MATTKPSEEATDKKVVAETKVYTLGTKKINVEIDDNNDLLIILHEDVEFVGRITGKELESHSIFKDINIVLDAIIDITTKKKDKYYGKLKIEPIGNDYVMTLKFESKVISDKLIVPINHLVASADDNFQTIRALNAKVARLEADFTKFRAYMNVLVPIIQVPMTNGHDIIYLSPMLVTKCTLTLMEGNAINIETSGCSELKFIPVLSVNKYGLMSKWNEMSKSRAMTLFTSFINLKTLELRIEDRKAKIDLAQFIKPTHAEVEEVAIVAVSGKKKKNVALEQINLVVAPIFGYKGLKKLTIDGEGINIVDRDILAKVGEVAVTLPNVEIK